MVVWLTGLSGAGKTTLALALRDYLKPSLPQTVLVDGDAVRAAFAAAAGYSEPERREQIQRIQRLAKLLADQDLIVVVAALYAHPELLAWNRANLPGYMEVYVKASMRLLHERDKKGLYAGATGNLRPNVVGIDIPWHEPTVPDLVIDSDEQRDPRSLALAVVAANPILQSRLAHARGHA